jgi:tRNA uridine 5-carbamoylmethylation protein Kti12
VVEIEDAPFGQSPLFKVDKVNDEDIDQMIQFDRNLVEQLEVITKTSELIYDHVLKGETSDIIMQVRKLKKELDVMKNTFSDRLDYFMKR